MVVAAGQERHRPIADSTAARSRARAGGHVLAGPDAVLLDPGSTVREWRVDVALHQLQGPGFDARLEPLLRLDAQALGDGQVAAANDAALGGGDGGGRLAG